MSALTVYKHNFYSTTLARVYQGSYFSLVVNRMVYPNFDIIIKFDQSGVSYSHNGGESWLRTANKWNKTEVMIQHIINRFAVYQVLNPSLCKGEELCGPCASRGKVGIMRFNRITEGKEAQTQVLYNEDGEPYTDDVYFWCRYRVVKCARCGHEDSDYA
jgi:hypothetical protein